MKKLILSGIICAALATPTFASNLTRMYFTEREVSSIKAQEEKVIAASKRGHPVASIFMLLQKIDALDTITDKEKYHEVLESIKDDILLKKVRHKSGKDVNMIEMFNDVQKAGVYGEVALAQFVLLDDLWATAKFYVAEYEVFKANGVIAAIEKEEVKARKLVSFAEKYGRSDVASRLRSYEADVSGANAALQAELQQAMAQYEEVQRQRAEAELQAKLEAEAKRIAKVKEDFEKGIVHSDAVDMGMYVFRITRSYPVTTHNFPLFQDFMTDSQKADYENYYKTISQ